MTQQGHKVTSRRNNFSHFTKLNFNETLKEKLMETYPALNLNPSLQGFSKDLQRYCKVTLTAEIGKMVLIVMRLRIVLGAY